MLVTAPPFVISIPSVKSATPFLSSLYITAFPERTTNSVPADAINFSPGLTSTILTASVEAAGASLLLFVEGKVVDGADGVVTVVPPFFKACCIA
ncbi:hypothetical protein D3C71_1861470 [compost metagenome]